MSLSELRTLAAKVKALYESDGPLFAQFQKESGLTCLPECGACCKHPEISAAVVEMLPVALHLLDQNQAQLVYEKLENGQAESPCYFYRSTSTDHKKGFCTKYDYRAVICRSFGACAVKNKDQKKTLSLCQLIKNNSQIDLDKVDIQHAPSIENFATLVRSIDSDLKIYPINHALKMALEKVLLYSSYENNTSTI